MSYVYCAFVVSCMLWLYVCMCIVYQYVLVCAMCVVCHVCVCICVSCMYHICMHVCAHTQPALITLFLCRGLLGRPGWRDSELLRQCRGSEQWLWGLPCSWVQVPAHAWGHAEELAKVVRGRILQEQARLVWVERGSSRGGSGSSSEA